MRRVARAAIPVALIAAACSDSSANGPADKQGETAELPPGAFLFAGEDPAILLSQCSRATPLPGESYWTPSAEHIVAFERALPEALEQSGNIPDGNRPEGERGGWSNFAERWTRQYIGINRRGSRTIYGNFYPNDTTGSGRDPATQAAIVCDGGEVFFGAEFDVQSGEVIHLAFNGHP